MIRKCIVSAAALMIVASFSFAQTNKPDQSNIWQPESFQLATRWSKEVSPVNALPEYPRPQMARKEWQNLNGLWDYSIVDSSINQPAKFQGKILVPYPIESALSGVKKQLLPNQRLWYRQILDIKQKQKGKRYLLHFGAIDFQASILVNKKLATQHTGGYQAFDCDITEALKDGKNELLVAVTDPSDKGSNPHGKQVLHPQGIMYTSCSGIWESVWLETVPEVYISGLRMTPDIDKGALQVTAKLNTNLRDYQIELQSGNGNTTKGAANQPLSLPVPNAHLWSPDDPYLYNLTVRLIYKGKVVDSVGSYFGMRKIELKKDADGQERIFLNHRYTFNLGVLDQGYWPDGIYTAPTDDALKYDITAIKSMGFNTIRKHIKIEPDRWYYHCDQLGMLVWQDMPNPSDQSIEARTEFEKEDSANIQQLYNHPSIVCWVLFNEGWNSYDQERLTNWMKSMDNSRLIDGHTGENYDRKAPKDVLRRWVASDMSDIHDYPGPNIAPGLPGKARVLGEWGGVRVPTPGHEWDSTKSWGYVETTRLDFARKYDFMIKHLKVYEEEGLTASIFTQPFDVEIEENGLITYDREVFKIPVATIKKSNELILNNNDRQRPVKNN